MRGVKRYPAVKKSGQSTKISPRYGRKGVGAGRMPGRGLPLGQALSAPRQPQAARIGADGRAPGAPRRGHTRARVDNKKFTQVSSSRGRARVPVEPARCRRHRRQIVLKLRSGAWPRCGTWWRPRATITDAETARIGQN